MVGKESDEFMHSLPGRLEVVGDTCYCYTTDPWPVMEKLRSATSITFLHRPSGLEDVFLKLTGRELRD